MKTYPEKFAMSYSELRLLLEGQSVDPLIISSPLKLKSNRKVSFLERIGITFTGNSQPYTINIDFNISKSYLNSLDSEKVQSPSLGCLKRKSKNVYSDGYARMGFSKAAKDIGSQLKGLASDLKPKLFKRYFDACLMESELMKEQFEIHVTSKLSSLDTQIVSNLELFLRKIVPQVNWIQS